MNRRCTPNDFRFLASQYAVIPNELNAVAEEMEKAGLEAVDVEVAQLFNTYMKKVPPAAQSAAGAVRTRIEQHKQAERLRVHLEGELHATEAASPANEAGQPQKATETNSKTKSKRK